MSVSHGCRCRTLVHQVQFVDIKSSAFMPVLRGPWPARRPNHRINESWTMLSLSPPPFLYIGIYIACSLSNKSKPTHPLDPTAVIPEAQT